MKNVKTREVVELTIIEALETIQNKFNEYISAVEPEVAAYLTVVKEELTLFTNDVKAKIDTIVATQWGDLTALPEDIADVNIVNVINKLYAKIDALLE